MNCKKKLSGKKYAAYLNLLDEKEKKMKKKNCNLVSASSRDYPIPAVYQSLVLQ